MGRKRKKNQPKTARKDKRHYDDILKENESYQHYYKEQKCFDVAEYDAFISAMKKPLPAVFRITGYKKHSKQLLKNMKKTHFEEMIDLKIDDEGVKQPVSLPWYPEELAWQTDLNRTQIRKVPQLQKFHAFLIAETESGHITRQEAVSMIPPLLLDVQPHHKVLDMCAAPGSKTAQIIELLHQDDSKPVPAGLCIANDKDNKRCYMLVHQTNRLSSPSTIIVNHDAATFPELYLKDDEGCETALRYHRVLCDVPCSGDGTIRKNSDVWTKWNIANSIYLHGIQLRILMRGLEVLTTGGQLVYSTCSINPIEDEAVVASALRKCAGAVELVSVDMPELKWSPGTNKWRVMDKNKNWYEKYSDLPEDAKQINQTMFPPEDEELVESMHLERCMRLLPHHQDTGGFFVSVLRKVSDLPWQKASQLKQSRGDGQELQERDNRPPRKKPKWVPGFKEDPFVFFSANEEGIAADLETFYGLKNFPSDQLLSRTYQQKKKHLYFVSRIVKNLVESNINFLKVVNTGVRVFSRSDNSQHDLKCAFRTVQDGVVCMEPFMTKQVVHVKMCDVIKLLSQEQPRYENLSEGLKQQLQNLEPGSIVYKYMPENEVAEVACDLLMCGWKGFTSTRLYMCKNERMHFLNLIGVPVPEYLLPNKNNRRSRAENDQKDKLNGSGERESVATSKQDSNSSAVENVEEYDVLDNLEDATECNTTSANV